MQWKKVENFLLLGAFHIITERIQIGLGYIYMELQIKGVSIFEKSDFSLVGQTRVYFYTPPPKIKVWGQVY